MQSREEWLKYRKGGIGSSDAPVIMGVSPWSTPFKLYLDKIEPEVKEDDSNSFIKQKGNDIEPRIRAYYELQCGESFSPELLEMSGATHLRASLDGLNKKKTHGIEIKLLGKEDFENLKKGIIPEKYKPQVHHQIMVGDLERVTIIGYLYEKGENSFDPSCVHTHDVLPDLNYQIELLEAENKFWIGVCTRRPPEFCDGDYKELRVKGAKALADKWCQLKLKIEELETEQAEIKAKLEGMVDHPRMNCGNVTIVHVNGRAGSVNYKKIMSLPEVSALKIDEEKYRGAPGKAYYKFSIKGEKKNET